MRLDIARVKHCHSPFGVEACLVYRFITQLRGMHARDNSVYGSTVCNRRVHCGLGVKNEG